MADLLFERDVAVQQEEEGRGRERWLADSGARVLLAEVEGLIAACLGQEPAPEWEMMTRLDGVPTSVILAACDRLGVTVRSGVWRIRRRA